MLGSRYEDARMPQAESCCRHERARPRVALERRPRMGSVALPAHDIPRSACADTAGFQRENLAKRPAAGRPDLDVLSPGRAAVVVLPSVGRNKIVFWLVNFAWAVGV